MVFTSLQEGHIPHIHLLLFQILDSNRCGVESRRGNFDKSAFFMEKINIPKVIFLSQEEINF